MNEEQLRQALAIAQQRIGGLYMYSMDLEERIAELEAMAEERDEVPE